MKLHQPHPSMHTTKLTLTVLAALLLAPMAALQANEFHVAIDGKDTNDGTRSAPFPTIQLAAEGGGSPAVAQSVGSKRPNVVFIVCDDLNHYVLHRQDFPQARTPNIDWLAQQGVTFANNHAVTPVCGPSRTCFWTGIYPQWHGNFNVWKWDSVPMLKNSVPMPQHFLNNGYAVYGTGKLFHEGAGGPFYTQYGIPPNYGPWPWRGKGREEDTAHPAQVAMFTPALPLNIQRDLNFGPLSNIPDWKPDLAGKFPGYTGWRSFGKPFRYVSDDDRDQMPDEISAQFAVDVLKQKHDRPFFLGVGFIRPHSPLYAPKKYFDMFPLESVRLPPHLTNDLDDCAVIMRQHWLLGFQKYHALLAAGGVPMWRQWVRAYLACMAFADEQVGKVLKALDESPYHDNTIVVLIADNGYHIGEKDAVQKWYLWEESTQVPLFIRAPGAAPGRTCTRPTSLIDLYPTLIDLCGLSKSPNAGKSEAPLGGHSLRPLLLNPVHGTWDGPPAALSVVSWQPNGPRDTGPHYSIRTENWRYTLCSDEEEELYDHAADPNEWTNLTNKAEYRAEKRELRALLTKLVRASTGPEKASPPAQGRGKGKSRNEKTKEQP